MYVEQSTSTQLCITTGEDLRRSTAAVTKAPASPVTRAIDNYFRLMKELSADDFAMRMAFWKVRNATNLVRDMNSLTSGVTIFEPAAYSGNVAIKSRNQKSRL